MSFVRAITKPSNLFVVRNTVVDPAIIVSPLAVAEVTTAKFSLLTKTVLAPEIILAPATTSKLTLAALTLEFRLLE